MGQKLKLGVIVSLEHGEAEGIEKAHKLGLPTCQIACWAPEAYTDENARKLKAAAVAGGVEITTIWAGLPGPGLWNFTEGPATIGLVPEEYRQMRVQALKSAADFAKTAGVPSITTHVGFVPENPADPIYTGMISAVTEVAVHCQNLGLFFCFETGQETPITLMRAIRDVGTDNLGINLDAANLLMYGKANPVDAVELIGPYVKGVHAKDGEYPTDPGWLGAEKPLGEGRVNYPVLIPKLKSYGFSGALTIEREISGEQQITDIRRAMEMLEPLL